MSDGHDANLDYSFYCIDVKKRIKEVEEHMNNKEYSLAEKAAMNAMVDMKLMWNAVKCEEEKWKR